MPQIDTLMMYLKIILRACFSIFLHSKKMQKKKAKYVFSSLSILGSRLLPGLGVGRGPSVSLCLNAIMNACTFY